MNTDESRGIKAFLSFAPAYCAGICIAACILLLRLLGIWRIEGAKNLPTLRQKNGRGLLVVSNHPSLLEPITLTSLFARWYIFRPKLGPWNIAETANFRRGLFHLTSSRILFVDRTNDSSKRQCLRRAISLLKNGSVFILFPEGGRTYRGRSDEFIAGANGRKIRRFTEGTAFMAIKTEAIVVPVWVEGTDKVSLNKNNARYSMLHFWEPVTIRVGRAFTFPKYTDAKSGTRELERAVLSC